MSDAVPPNFLLEPTPYVEAVRWIADKPVVSRKVFDAMVPELRARAFLITGIEDANAAGEIRDILAKLPAGQSWEKTKAELVGKLGPWLSSDDDENKAANARAELLLRTHGFQAYQVAQHKVMREQEDVFPYWQYLSLDDEKVRPGHAGLNLKVAPAKSAFWNDHSPPWQWGCRCRKVPLLPGDVIEMMTEDAKLPPEQQRVLSPAGLKLAEQGRMYNKAGQQLDIKSDRQKGKLEGFIFDPEALTLPLSSLKGRYDAVTWGEFEKAMKAEKLDDGRTVWGWLDGEVAPKPKAGAKPGPAPVPAPLPETKPESAPAESEGVKPGEGQTEADGTPLAGKLNAVRLTKKEQNRVAGVLAAIDRVHGDGPLTAIPVTHKPGRGNLGVFRHWPGGKAVDIGYRKSKAVGLHPELTLAHEIGHWLDYSGAPGENVLTSDVPGGAFAEVIAAAKKSQAYAELLAMPEGKAQRYYTKPVEIFARAYSQFIAEESNDAAMLQQVADIRADVWPGRQWEKEDFKETRDAMRAAFVKLGWMKEVKP